VVADGEVPANTEMRNVWVTHG
jgi:hypothetical protein